MTEEEDFAESMLLLDSIDPSELQDDDERTLLEEAVSTLLLDSFLMLEEKFTVATLLLDSSPQRITPLAQQVAQSRISLSFGVTGEELLSSSQATS